MPTVKRYVEDFPEGMVDDIEGKWVKYEDYAALAELLKEARDWIDTEDHHPDLVGRINKLIA